MKLDLLDALNISAILIGIPYFAGYIYLHAYFGHFGVSVTELELGESYIFVNAFSFLANLTGIFVQSSYLEPTLVILICIVLVLVALQLNPLGLLLSKKLNMISVVSVYAILLVCTYFLATYTGEVLAKNHAKLLPPVFVFHASTPDYKFYQNENLITDFGSFRFLFATEKVSFIVRRTPSGENFQTIRLPNASHLVTATVIEN